MNAKLERLIEIRDRSESTIFAINNLLQKEKVLHKTIEDINYLRQNAGIMIFTGKSGKISEDAFLRQVRINDIAGCVAIPKLMLTLASQRLKELETDIEKMINPAKEQP